MIENTKNICANYTITLIAHRILWEYRMLKMGGFPGELESFVEYWICSNVAGFNDEFVDRIMQEVLDRIGIDNAS